VPDISTSESVRRDGSQRGPNPLAGSRRFHKTEARAGRSAGTQDHWGTPFKAMLNSSSFKGRSSGLRIQSRGRFVLARRPRNRTWVEDYRFLWRPGGASVCLWKSGRKRAIQEPLDRAAPFGDAVPDFGEVRTRGVEFMHDYAPEADLPDRRAIVDGHDGGSYVEPCLGLARLLKRRHLELPGAVLHVSGREVNERWWPRDREIVEDVPNRVGVGARRPPHMDMVSRLTSVASASCG